MADDEKEVGYCRTPVHTRYKPGQSGNPGGRKSGSRGFKTDLEAEATAKHSININGKKETGTRQQLAIRTLAIRAASGDLKAVQMFLPMILQVLGTEDRGKAKERLSAEDQALLEEILGTTDEDTTELTETDDQIGEGYDTGLDEEAT